MTKREENTIKIKEKVHTATLELMKEKDFDKILVSDITERAGIAKSSFYTYFDSKEDLLYKIFLDFDTSYTNAYERVKSYKSFHSMITAFFTFAYLNYERYGKNCYKSLYKIPNFTMLDKNRNLYKILSEMVQFGFETCELSDKRSVDFYVEKLILALISCDFHLFNSEDESDFLAYIMEHYETILNGITQ